MKKKCFGFTGFTPYFVTKTKCFVMKCFICAGLPIFKVLHTAQTAEPAVHHDSHSGTECFTLLHTVTNHERKHVFNTQT